MVREGHYQPKEILCNTYDEEYMEHEKIQLNIEQI